MYIGFKLVLTNIRSGMFTIEIVEWPQEDILIK